MLERLTADNFALIEHSSVELGRGFGVITGETGSGKTIWLQALRLACGARMSREMIRSGCDRASVEAVFSSKNYRAAAALDRLEVPPDPTGRIVMSREITLSGQSRCRVNGVPVSVNGLRDLASALIDIHGQFDNQSLFDPAEHIGVLDRFGYETVSAAKNEYLGIYRDCMTLRDRLKTVRGSFADREKAKDLLEYRIKEIEDAGVSREEYDSLLARRRALIHFEKIQRSAGAALDILTSGGDSDRSAVAAVQEAGTELARAAALDGSFAGVSDRLIAAGIELRDLSDELSRLADGLGYDDAEADRIESRLGIYEKMTRKYGGSVEEALSQLESYRSELADLNGSEELAAGYAAELAARRQDLKIQALALSERRHQAAGVLEDRVARVLRDLEMGNVTFKAVFADYDPETAKLGRNGFDSVEFMISANQGEPLKPLARIGSGGEISRIMLAIKSIISDVDDLETLVFDEIDTGISGVAAQQVGLKLRSIGEQHQVLCITHHGIVAAMAEDHYRVSKTTDGGRTFSRMEKLDDEQRVLEISRVIGGDRITDLDVEHSKELINRFKK